MQTSSQVLWTPEWRCVMVTLKGSSGYFECQGHNSLNSGLILKILVPKHISFPRPFFFILWSITWHVAMWPKTCPKVGPWKMKITKVKKTALVCIFQLNSFIYRSPQNLWRGLSLKSQVYRVMSKKVMSSDFFTFRGCWQPQSASEVI